MRPTTEKKSLLDVQQEKEVFLKVRQDFVDTNSLSTPGQVRSIPKRFEQLIRKPPMKNVREFFKICLALIHYKDEVAELTTLIDETKEDLRPNKRVNHIRRKLKTGRELRMIVQIGDYDMDYIILDIGSDINILTRHTCEIMNKP